MNEFMGFMGRRASAAVVVSVLVFGGCAVYASHWIRAETSEEQRDADHVACQRETMDAGRVLLTLFLTPVAVVRTDAQMRACMIGKGYEEP